jgi:catechol 2,3-dioxygenase-like lactoylglutathione lyase family enzyme
LVTIDGWFTVDAMLSDAMVHPTIMVSDMGRARAFYEGLLGLPMVREMAPYVFLRAGTSQLALVARASVTPPATTTCAFEVDDLEKTVSALRARGVVFEEYDLPTLRTINGIAEVGPFRAAWVRDPDGNYVGIHDKGR